MHRRNRVAALVLAGGYSSRAQAFKPLLPLTETTIIERSIANFFRAGIHQVSVVLGHRADLLLPVLADLPVCCVFNDRYAEGMFSSIIAGVQSLPPDTEAFFLMPVDMPLVRSHTLRLLYRAFAKQKRDIIYPVFQGRRGHPPLISAKLIPEIMAGDKTFGLRPILAQYAADSLEIEVLDEGILHDADTPADYRTLVEFFHNRDVPSQAECAAILDRMQVREQAVKHGALVAGVAGKLADALNCAGRSLNIPLLTAAGKLHDLAKGRPDHAHSGARLLRKMGYPKVAELVAVHHDIECEGSRLDEAALLYLADKLVQGDRLVTLDERFGGPREKYAADKEALKAMEQRYRLALETADAVERIAGAPLGEIIAEVDPA